MHTHTLFLRDDLDWVNWWILFRIQAEILGVWDFIDPKKDDVNVIPGVPKMPKEFVKMAKLARTDGRLSSKQCENYQRALNHFFDSTIVDFGMDMHQYYQRLHGLEKMEAVLDSTVNIKLYGNIINADVTLREKLTLLVHRLDTSEPRDETEIRGAWLDDENLSPTTVPKITLSPVADEFVSKPTEFEPVSASEDSIWAGKEGDDNQEAISPLHSSWDAVYDAIDNLKHEQCTPTEETRTTCRKRTMKSRPGVPPPLKTAAKAKPATLQRFGRCEWCRRQHVPEGEQAHWKSCYYCLPELCEDMNRRVFFTEGKRWESVHNRLRHHPKVYRKIIRFQIDQSMKEWRAHQDNAGRGLDSLPISSTALKPAKCEFW